MRSTPEQCHPFYQWPPKIAWSETADVPIARPSENVMKHIRSTVLAANIQSPADAVEAEYLSLSSFNLVSWSAMTRLMSSTSDIDVQLALLSTPSLTNVHRRTLRLSAAVSSTSGLSALTSAGGSATSSLVEPRLFRECSWISRSTRGTGSRLSEMLFDDLDLVDDDSRMPRATARRLLTRVSIWQCQTFPELLHVIIIPNEHLKI